MFRVHLASRKIINASQIILFVRSSSSKAHQRPKHQKAFEFKLIIPLVFSQDELNSDLDLSEARASLLSGDVVELINATSVDSTSMKLLWEVSERGTKSCVETFSGGSVTKI